jgi:hypothetical protein
MAVRNISRFVVKLREHKRKLHEENDSTMKATNNERGHIVSPASSNNSVSRGD